MTIKAISKPLTKMEELHSLVTSSKELSSIDHAMTKLSVALLNPELSDPDRLALRSSAQILKIRYEELVNQWWVVILAFFISSYGERINISKAQLKTLVKLSGMHIVDGLPNQGNTCFMNASLQAFLAVGFKKVETQSDFANTLQKLIEESSYGAINSDTLAHLRSAAYRAGIVQSLNGQEDVAEFFPKLLEAVNFPPIKISGAYQYAYPTVVGPNWPQSETKTLEDDSFVIVKPHPSQQTVKGHYDLNVCLNTELDPRETTLIAEDAKGKKLELPQGTLVTMERKFETAPDILPIQVARYAYDPQTKTQSRLAFHVDNMDTVDISILDDSTVEYRLHAVCIHRGLSPHSGHYYAYIRIGNEDWLKCDDSCVSSSQPQEVADDSSKNGVIFIYRKITQP